MKIFVSYSRRDAGDFANQINRHLSTFNYDIFTDVDDIIVGEIWSNTIEQNISDCDIFVVIVTHGALHSPHVEREVLQAQAEKKTIIPCFHKDVIDSDIKWGLDKIQGVEFDDKYELARNIRSKISSSKGKGGIFDSTSQTVDEAKTQASKTTSKSNTETIPQQKDPLPPSYSKYPRSESNNREESPGIDSRSGKRSQAINLKIIIIPIVAVTVIALIVSITYYNPSFHPSEPITPSQPSLVPEITPPETKQSISPPTSKQQQYRFINTWGSLGTAKGQFDHPRGVAVDSTDNVYVADNNNDRIQKFDSNGNFITSFGSPGTSEGKFENPQGVAVDSTDNVYVADLINDRIQKFDSNGNFITSWGSEGEGNGEFKGPRGIAIDSTDSVYVADQGNSRIQKFDSNGNFITSWGSFGLSEGKFRFLVGVTVDSTDNVYVADKTNDRIQKFDSNGNFITSFGSHGTSEGKLNKPSGVAVDSTDNVYVADTGNSDSYNNRIQKFDSNGNFITSFGSPGTSEGNFDEPSGVAVDFKDNVYVADTGNNRIQVFAPATT